MSYVVEGYVTPGYVVTPLTTRIVTNTGEGMSEIDASITAGWKIIFELVDKFGKVANAADATSGHELVGYRVVGDVDASNGVFSVPLWPTDRAEEERYYRCRLTFKGRDMWPSFIRPLPSGDLGDMLFSDFKGQDRWGA